jgi:hypothetical protein
MVDLIEPAQSIGNYYGGWALGSGRRTTILLRRGEQLLVWESGGTAWLSGTGKVTCKSQLVYYAPRTEHGHADRLVLLEGGRLTTKKLRPLMPRIRDLFGVGSELLLLACDLRVDHTVLISGMM